MATPATSAPIHRQEQQVAAGYWRRLTIVLAIVLTVAILGGVLAIVATGDGAATRRASEPYCSYYAKSQRVFAAQTPDPTPPDVGNMTLSEMERATKALDKQQGDRAERERVRHDIELKLAELAPAELKSAYVAVLVVDALSASSTHLIEPLMTRYSEATDQIRGWVAQNCGS